MRDELISLAKEKGTDWIIINRELPEIFIEEFIESLSIDLLIEYRRMNDRLVNLFFNEIIYANKNLLVEILIKVPDIKINTMTLACEALLERKSNKEISKILNDKWDTLPNYAYEYLLKRIN